MQQLSSSHKLDTQNKKEVKNITDPSRKKYENQEMVIYEGRSIPKKHFRAYIYKANGEQLLVNSYDEYISHLETGIWYSNVDQIKAKEPSKTKA